MADDAATFVLNGQNVASCTPPSGDISQCSASCQSAVVPTNVLLGDGQVNTLEIELTNLLSVARGRRQLRLDEHRVFAVHRGRRGLTPNLPIFL